MCLWFLLSLVITATLLYSRSYESLIEPGYYSFIFLPRHFIYNQMAIFYFLFFIFTFFALWYSDCNAHWELFKYGVGNALSVAVSCHFLEKYAWFKFVQQFIEMKSVHASEVKLNMQGKQHTVIQTKDEYWM